MFFFIAKTLGAMAHAPEIFLEALLAGVVLLWTKWRRAGRALVAIAGLALALFGFTTASSFLARPLEDRFPQARIDEPPTGIIVLGGSVDEGVSQSRGAPALNDAAERLTEAVALARRFPQARLVFSGGSGRMNPAMMTESDVVRDLWTRLGVPAAQMTFEDRSRDTWENAVFTKEIVQPKPGERWLLVTSAMHMPRSVGIFRKIDFPVIPYPVDFQTGGTPGDFVGFRRPAPAFYATESATHEWIGLVSYYLAGKSSALFPAP